MSSPDETGRIAAARRRTRRGRYALAIGATATFLAGIPLAWAATTSGTDGAAPAPTITVLTTSTAGEDGSSVPDATTTDDDLFGTATVESDSDHAEHGQSWQLVPETNVHAP